MEEHFTVKGPVEATVKLGSGRVDTRPSEPGTAWARVEPVNPDHEASVRLAARATVTLVNGQLLVEVPTSGRLLRSAEVAVSLGLPASSGLAVKGGVVNVTVRGGVEALAVKLGAGDVDVDLASSSVAVKAGQTSVAIGTAGAVTVSAGLGRLRADRVGNTSFKAGQGSVELGRTEGAVAVKGGSVQLEIREAGPGDVVFETGSGDARIGVAAGTTVQVDLTSASGDVRCDLPLESDAPAGGAGLRLRLRTGRGDVRVAATADPVPSAGA